MNKPSVITVPNPILRQVTRKVTSFDNKLKSQIEQMIKILRKEEGIGLAANQLGFNNRVLIIEFQDPDKKNHIPLTILINPEIVDASTDKDCLKEGCLSIPKIELDVERSKSLKIKYQNEIGRKFKIAPKGLLARVLQHEIDHLNGIIFTERVKEQFYTKYPELRNLKILFFGTGEFGAMILKGLILLGFDLTIVTEKAKPAGRDKETKPTAVAQVAEKFGRKYIEIESRSASYLLTGAGERQYDLIICSDFGQKIPDSILKQAKITAINIHPSLLPKYRGPSPIQAAILNDEKKVGVTVIKMTDKIDAGPVLAQAEMEILENDNYLTLRDRLSTLASKLLVKTLPDIAHDNLKPILQDDEAATFTHKFTKADGEIDWKKSPKEIYAQIRALYPWPGSYTVIDNKRLIIHRAHLEPTQTPNQGRGLSGLKLVLDIVQPEGKKPMKFADFLRGYHGPKPEWFEKIKS